MTDKGTLSSILTGKRSGGLGSSIDGSVQNLDFTFNAIGNLTQRRDLARSITEDFGYDARNQLTSATCNAGPSLAMTYDALGNMKSKTGITSYTYGESGAGPHAVTSYTDSAGKKHTLLYDRAGNCINDDGTTLSFTSNNQPAQIKKGSATLQFTYGPGRARYRQTETTATSYNTKLYIGSLYERDDNTTTGTVTHTHYIPGGSGIIAIKTQTQTSTTRTDKLRYVHRDHLGSIQALSDENGNLSETLNFDAWGKRRALSQNATTRRWSLSYATVTSQTDRGYTGHEMLDLVGLIHMNGRIYDPTLARFLSVDPVVQEAGNLLNLNRYSYVLNNPLSLTDPSGFKFWKSVGNFVKKLVAHAVGNAVGFVSATVAFLATGNPYVAYVAFKTGYGFGSSFSGTLMAGGSIGDSLRAGLNGAAYAFANALAQTLLPGPLAFAAQAAISGARSEANGGSFRHGFTGFIRNSAKSAAQQAAFDFVADYAKPTEEIQQGCYRGTSSENGGKFANGANTNSFIFALAGRAERGRPAGGNSRISQTSILVNEEWLATETSTGIISDAMADGGSYAGGSSIDAELVNRDGVAYWRVEIEYRYSSDSEIWTDAQMSYNSVVYGNGLISGINYVSKLKSLGSVGLAVIVNKKETKGAANLSILEHIDKNYQVNHAVRSQVNGFWIVPQR